MPADVAVSVAGHADPFLQDGGLQLGVPVQLQGVGVQGVNKMCRTGSPETKSGSMILVGPGKHSQTVQVKVYRTSLEHFAVVYPQKKICRPLGFLNLRNTLVERLSPSASNKFNDVSVKSPLGCCNAKVRQAPVWIPRSHQHHGGFVVRQRGCDSPNILTFLTENPKDLDAWISAFDSKAPASIQACPLPILEEGEE